MILAEGPGDRGRAHPVREVSRSRASSSALPANRRCCSRRCERAEREILEALRAAHGSRREVAEKLGISPRTLRYKLARLRSAGVDVPAA